MAKKDATEYNKIGNDHYSRAEYDKAREYYERAVAEDNEFTDAYYNLGLVYKSINNIDQSKKHFLKAVELDPLYADAWNQLGIIYYDENLYDQAEEYYHKALEKSDKQAHVYYNLSLIENARNNQSQRKFYLEKSLSIKPNYSLALNEMGNLYYDASEYDTAKSYYEKALLADSQNKYAHYNLGLIAEIELDYHKARDCYEKSLKCDPNYDIAKKGLNDVKEKISKAGDLLDTEKSLPHKTDNENESYIKKIGRNLNELAKEGKLNDAIGRDKEINTIFEILYKRFKNNPILIGNAGVGKTAIVEGIAKKIVDGTVPDHFKNKEIVEINTGYLIAGTKYRGEFEVKIKKILDDAKNNENIILFIDEIHSIIGAGRVEDSNLDIAQMLKPALQRGEITCIGATTINEYRKYFENDPALERRFYPVVIDEMTPEATIEILLHNLEKAGNYYNIEYTKENVHEIVDLCAKHLKKRYFPDKAIDIFEKLSSRISLKGDKKINSKDIRELIAETAGIAFIEDDADEISKLATIEDKLKKEIFGQDEAVNSICNLLRIAKRRLDLRPERPDGVFLFTGPTGVGKTYLAKCLCKHLFGDEHKLISMDMSEFSEPHSVAKITGAPPGYVGYDDISPLTGMIEENPSSILLLDEIEKAHENVIKLFLQVFEEGRITDSKGKKIYFSDVTIIMTSNVLAREKGSLGFLNEQSGKNRMESVIFELSKFFPKEFLNRIDEIIIFNPLTEKDAENILVKNIFNETQERFKQEGISLIFDKNIQKEIVKEGYSPELGARNLQRLFERRVLSPLVKYIYDMKNRNATINLKFKNEDLEISEK